MGRHYKSDTEAKRARWLKRLEGIYEWLDCFPSTSDWAVDFDELLKKIEKKVQRHRRVMAESEELKE